MGTRKPATVSEVRAWAVEQGTYSDRPFLGEGARGLVPNDVREAFTKATRRHIVKASEVTVSLPYPAQDKRGRNITKNAQVAPSELRALAGVTATHGRISKAALQAAGEAYAASLSE